MTLFLAPVAVVAKAEVEIGGTISLPARAQANGAFKVFITDGVCWKPETRYFGEAVPTSTGRWFVEIFVPQGTRLWACGALAPTADGTIVYSGSGTGGPYLAQGAGEVRFPDVRIELKKGAPVALPPKR